MQRDASANQKTSTLWFFIWALLLLGLPLAFVAAVHPPIEYKATLGIDALDCQGPFETYIFAAPALLLYGAGLISNGLMWKRPAHLIVAVLCFVVCGGITMNEMNAMVEEREQSADCRNF